MQVQRRQLERQLRRPRPLPIPPPPRPPPPPPRLSAPSASPRAFERSDSDSDSEGEPPPGPVPCEERARAPLLLLPPVSPVAGCAPAQLQLSPPVPLPPRPNAAEAAEGITEGCHKEPLGRPLPLPQPLVPPLLGPGKGKGRGWGALASRVQQGDVTEANKDLALPSTEAAKRYFRSAEGRVWRCVLVTGGGNVSRCAAQHACLCWRCFAASAYYTVGAEAHALCTAPLHGGQLALAWRASHSPQREADH